MQVLVRPFLVFSQCREKKEASSLVSLLIRARIPSGEIHPHEIITSHRVTSPNTMALRIRLSTHELGWICVWGVGVGMETGEHKNSVCSTKKVKLFMLQRDESDCFRENASHVR